ncbi:hypothetical protein KFK09_026648 [Dendrobium nobile]|uniref:Uncharacterized protein n=1 Tax=Dendrobium nobile TaxID=94219 RepID=A0A8T3A7E8_DENNO|nr:hypothetical protein KFK09_026648 [Dendrobium nobile]
MSATKFWKLVCNTAIQTKALFGFKVAGACNFSLLWDTWFCGDSLGNHFYDYALVGCEVMDFISNGAWTILDSWPVEIKQKIITISVEDVSGVDWVGISKPSFKNFNSHFF